MKATISFIFVIAAAILVSSAGFALDDGGPQAPQAFIPHVRYEFPEVLEGTEVSHDFIIQNKGSADLEIKEVRTG